MRAARFTVLAFVGLALGSAIACSAFSADDDPLPVQPEAGGADGAVQDAAASDVNADAVNADGGAGADADADAAPTREQCLGSDAGAQVLANSVPGFSGQQTLCGWSYGYNASASNVFVPFTRFDGSKWLPDDDAGASRHARLYSHPDTNIKVVRRWTSDRVAMARLMGTVTTPVDGGNGVGFDILVNGTSVLPYTRTVGGNPFGATFGTDANLIVGTTVDFVIDANGNPQFDTANFEATIEQK
jgi:hypothetical protein